MHPCPEPGKLGPNSDVLWTGWQGFDSRQVQEIFYLSTKRRPALAITQPCIEWAPVALSHGVKRPGREAHNSHSSSAEVKKGGAILPPLPHAFIA
jgi:hypothetical protein